MVYQALLIVSFGGPEGPDDVMPFLENVLRGKNVPRQRMLEVAEHYMHFGGISPINAQCRELIASLASELAANSISIPIYWGNRNWHPLLSDTIRQMADDGIERALAFFTSSFSSYSGCRQYRENIADACALLGERAPQIDRLRLPFNHPDFIDAQAELLQRTLSQIPKLERRNVPVLFCAHSIPVSMAENCLYESQLREVGRLVSETSSVDRWELVFQSRSGPPQQPWLEPDVCDRIRQLKESENISRVVVDPIGFISDHIEVLYDLDCEAKSACDSLGIQLHRVPTVGTHPRYIELIRKLIVERMELDSDRPVIGQLGPNPDRCLENCCLCPSRR